jgi:hypothetical protein
LTGSVIAGETRRWSAIAVGTAAAQELTGNARAQWKAPNGKRLWNYQPIQERRLQNRSGKAFGLLCLPGKSPGPGRVLKLKT